MNRPTISVVVPTTGRPELARALAGVRGQDYDGAVECIVVVDAPARSVVADGVVESVGGDATVLFTGGRMRAGYARNLGTAAARGEWVAYLDDDDEWHPAKLRRQMDLASAEVARGRVPVVSSRVRQQREGDTTAVGSIPRRLIGPQERVEDYLFRRRRPGARRASIYTSTLLVPRRRALEVPWAESLARHQDWDWLVRLQDCDDVVIVQCPDDLVTISVGSASSISAGADWQSSLAWAQHALAARHRRTYVDFLTAQTLRYALHARSAAGVTQTLRAIWSERTAPSPGPALIGLGGLASRKLLEGLLRWIR